MAKIKNRFDDSVLKQMRSIREEMEGIFDVGKKLKDLKISFKETKKLADDINKVSTSTEKLSQKQIEQNKIRERTSILLAKTSAERTKEGKELTKAIEARKKQTAAIKEEITGQKKANEATKEAAKSSALISKAKKQQVIAQKKAITTWARESNEIKRGGLATLKRVGQESLYFKEIKKTNIAKEKATRLSRAEAAALATGIGSYKRMGIELNKNINKYQSLSEKQRNNRAVGGKLLKNIQRQDKAYKKLGATLGRHQGQVGNYAIALRGLRGLMGALGVTGGIIAFTSVLRNSIGRIQSFDKAMTSVSAIAGKTREELITVEKIIRDVAAESTNTATEVAQLTETLFALGKSPEEIKKLIKPVNDLSIALDATSAEAGELLVGTLNAFGESASSANRYADVIAKMRTSTALNFERIKDSLGFIAPTAKAVGLSIEGLGARIGVLVDNNVKAARAGRLLNTSFLRLASNGKTLEDALDEINEAQDEGADRLEVLALAGELFGKNAAGLGLILANNRDRVAELTTEYENAGGSLDTLTKDKLKSLSAALNILNSAWEEQILKANENTGATQVFVKTLNFLARNLQRILSTILSLIAVFIAYKTALFATSIGLKAVTLATKIYRIANIALSRGIKSASFALKGFKAALVSTGIGALVVGLGFALEAFLNMKSSAEEAEESIRSAKEEFKSFLETAELKDLEDKAKDAAVGIAVLEASYSSMNDEIKSTKFGFETKENLENAKKDLGLINDRIIEINDSENKRATDKKKADEDAKKSKKDALTDKELKAIAKLENQLIKDTLKNVKDANTQEVIANKNKYAVNLSDEEAYTNKSKQLQIDLIQDTINGYQTLIDEKKVTGDQLIATEDNISKLIVDKKVAEIDEKIRLGKEEIKDAEELGKAILAASERTKKRTIDARIEAARVSSKTDEEFRDKVFAINNEILADEIETLKAQLTAADITAAAKIGIAEDIKDAELELNKLKNDELIRQDDEREEKEKERTARQNAAIQGAAEIGRSISNAVFENRNIKREEEATAQEETHTKEREDLQKLLDDKVITEDVYKSRSVALDEKQAAEKSKLLTKQAKEKRKDALWQVAINTIVAASTTLAQLGLPAAIPALIAVAAAGVASAIAIAAKPIPSFEKGGVMAQDGTARVSEKGQELMIEPSGKMLLTPEKESLIQIKGGTEIVPAHKTIDRIHKELAFNPTLNKNDNNTASLDLLKKIDRSINSQPQSSGLTGSGVNEYVKRHNQTTRFLNRRHRQIRNN